MSTQAYCLRSAASYKVCGVAQGPKADEVIVTVQNDGVVCYSSARQVNTIPHVAICTAAEVAVLLTKVLLPAAQLACMHKRKRMACTITSSLLACTPCYCLCWLLTILAVLQEQTRSWALNSQQLEFVVPTVHCQASDRYYTVVQEKKASSSTPQTLLSWPATVTHGSLEQTAQRQPLQGIVHSIHAPPAAAVKTPARGQSSGIVIVYTDGTVVSSNTEAVASVKAVGKRVINANVNGNQLAVVSTGKSRSDSMLELYSLQVMQ